MNRALGLFICCVLLHVATSTVISSRNVNEDGTFNTLEDEHLAFATSQDQLDGLSGDDTVATFEGPQEVTSFSNTNEDDLVSNNEVPQEVTSFSDPNEDDLVNQNEVPQEVTSFSDPNEDRPVSNNEVPQEVTSFSDTNEDNLVSNTEVPQQIKQYTKEQLQYQFEILKACTQSPAAFSVQFISHMQHVFRLFANELRSAFVNEVELAFQAAMSDPGKVMTQEAMDEYYIILDTVKNWDISRRNLVRIFDRVAAYSRDEINQVELQQAIMEIIKDEIVEDEQAFQRGDISSFIKNAVIVDDYEQTDFNAAHTPTE